MVWGGFSQLGANMFVNLSQDKFLKSYKVRKLQAQFGRTFWACNFLTLYITDSTSYQNTFIYFAITHSSYHLKTIPCQSYFNPSLWDPVHNIHQPNNWPEEKKSNNSFINSLPYQVIRGGYKSGGCTSRRGQQHVYILLLNICIVLFHPPPT